MAREDLAGQPDGAVLRTTAHGLQLIRRRKHEPINFQQLSRNELDRRTSIAWGSKFLPDWTLQRYLDWLESALENLPWSSDGAFPRKGRHRVRLDAEIGYVDGTLVHTIELSWDGSQVHAYPVKDD